MALAPQPPAPVRQFSFTDFQVANPTAPPPGDKLDGEYDRADISITQTIAWVASSLNTDGTLRAGTVGTSQLVSGLFDDVAQGIIDEVQPLVDQAANSATSAFGSAGNADTSAGEAETANVAAQYARTASEAASSAADLARMDANSSALTAGNKATDAANAANHAAGDAALAQDWGIVSRDWAEHMPDTIPPNTLAVMGVTGEHWSARWWAHKAEGAFGALTSLYLGAFPEPPTTTALGEPIPLGAMYYNTTSNQPFVWNGTEWMPFYTPVQALLLTLIYSAAAGQTVFVLTDPDLHQNTYTIDAANPEPTVVYANGVRLPPNAPVAGVGDWVLDPLTSTITLVEGLKDGDLVQVDVLARADSASGVLHLVTQTLLDFNIDPATDLPGQIDGVRTTFPLVLAGVGHAPVSVSSVNELVVSVDGVIQQPGVDFSVASTNITFAEAPLLGARAWGVWHAPETAP